MNLNSSFISHLSSLHAEMAACAKCNEAGFFAETSTLVVSPLGIRPRMMLVGQAPASPLRSKGKPFSGQAGRVLFGWLARAGFSEDEFRACCYFTAITKCYPGPANPPARKGEPDCRSPSGAESRGSRGDRVPTATERALCLPFLLRELTLIQPRLILTVGRLSTAHFLGSNLDFTDAIGNRFERDGRIILPLPHPSGVSRWTNDPRNKERLTLALQTLQHITTDEL